MEPELLAAARAGDEDAFRELVEPYRAQLHAHCYRMLGSFHDAEDVLQETLLRAWRALPRFGGRQLVRPWLFRIATNACLDALARRARRGLPVDVGSRAGPDDELGEPLAESSWVEPYPDADVPAGLAGPDARYEQRETIELAFVAALQHLTASQRAVLILRDVLGFTARETAESLQASVPAVNSALQRARRSISERVPSRSQQATLRALGDTRVRDLVRAYLDAWERGDVRALAALLAEDATFSMPPYRAWWRGRETIAAFAAEPVHRYLPTSANGQAADGTYRWNEAEGAYLAEAVEVLSFEGELVKEMVAFMTPDAFPRFGLPSRLG